MEFIRFFFDDFWHFLELAVLLLIFTQWTPVYSYNERNIVEYGVAPDDKRMTEERRNEGL